jgi:hypothetical protein
MKLHDKEAKQSVDELDENHIENEQIDFSKSFYAPYHSRAKKMFRSLQKSFGINVVYKKTQTLSNLLFDNPGKTNGKPHMWSIQSHAKNLNTSTLVKLKDQ